MQQESASHGINLDALGRKKQTFDLASEPVALEVPGLKLFYGDKQALYDVRMNIPKNRVTAFIGPSGCGKSTLLRCFNRMNDLVDGCRVEGGIKLDGQDIYRKGVDVAELRRRVGMVFQKPNPFPKSIYENVVYGLRIQGINKKRTLDDAVEWALKGAALWDEVKDRLHDSASAFPAASSSVWSSPAPSRSSRRCCCSTSPVRHSIRSPLSRSRN